MGCSVSKQVGNHRKSSNKVSKEIDTERTEFSCRLPSDDEIKVRRSGEAGSASYVYTATASPESAPKPESRAIEFAAYTQRGYYPDKLDKMNQDTYCTSIEDDSSFFAVCDGHGPKGEIFASYAKTHLPLLISKHMKEKQSKLVVPATKGKKGKDRSIFSNLVSLSFEESPASEETETEQTLPLLTEKELEDVSTKAHLECNKNMLDNYPTDVKYSGTTAASVCIHNGKLIVSNVGDSRVVLGSSDTDTNANTRQGTDTSGAQNSIVAVPLTKDQTPWRKDERDRIKQAGGKILTIGQIEGYKPMEVDCDKAFGDISLGEDGFMDVEGDPPRVWCEDKHGPGASFTRSLGDGVGDKIGVYAQPEFYCKDITDDDQVVVIASDGVFEFMANQTVIDICAKHSSPAVACEEIVQSAFEAWFKYDDRTDDITVIVIYLGGQVVESSDTDVTTSNSSESEEPEE